MRTGTVGAFLNGLLSSAFPSSPEPNVDLSEIRIGQPEQLVAQASAELRACLTVEGACSRFARELYEQSTVAGEPSLVLSRIYLTLPFHRLAPAAKEKV